LFCEGGENPADALVDDFDGLDGRREDAGVADHVAVGEVDDDEVVVAGVDSADDFIADAGGAHLGPLVVSGHILRGGDDLAILTREWLFAVVVEKKCDVGKFFGFGAAELLEAKIADVLAEDVGHLRRLGIGDVNGETLLVGGHGAIEEVELWAAVESLEVGLDERLGNCRRQSSRRF
jgi:hypothetical protein